VPYCGWLRVGGESHIATPAQPTTTVASFADVVQRVRSGVIRIEVETCDGSAVGTGVLVGPRLVATVEHVVDGADAITLKRSGKLLDNATVIGLDRRVQRAR
jgi:S1-C subfamily serine protease